MELRLNKPINKQAMFLSPKSPAAVVGFHQKIMASNESPDWSAALILIIVFCGGFSWNNFVIKQPAKREGEG